MCIPTFSSKTMDIQAPQQYLDEHIIMFLIIIAMYYRKRWRRRPKRYQTRPWLRRRLEQGMFDNLLVELQRDMPDMRDYTNFLRVDPEMFQELLRRLGPRLTKITTNLRKPLSPAQKLALALRFFASGDKYVNMGYG